ncbi:hypothetical protein [Nonlabens antarcticus]|uniref:hypothetical protein n=1 Tax=Nonlabens antarcticus TaxID=392714 RepID=UPI00189173D0|nr:hypothetical protein [Nonlabens antarcticus]
MKNSFILWMVFGIVASSFAQVGINTATPDDSAILDITSTDKGVLFPRMDLKNLNEASPISNPQESLVVWNTDTKNGGAKKGFYYWDGEWKRFGIVDDRLSGVFGQLKLSSNVKGNLRAAFNNTVVSIKGSSTGKFSGVTLNEPNFKMNTQLGGLYEIKFTVTFKNDKTVGSNQIEFYTTQNNNLMQSTVTSGLLSSDKNSVTFVGNVNLIANAEYALGFRPAGLNPSNKATTITIFEDLTQFSIKRL